PDAFPYINEPTISNLEIETPDHYFLEAGADVKQAIAERDTVLPFKKGILGDIIAEVFKRYKISETSKMLDRLKDLGFSYATKAGMKVGVSDIVNLKEKEELLDEAQEKDDGVTREFRRRVMKD